MNEPEKWDYILKLDDALLLGGVIISEWSIFLIKDADTAFCKGANLAAILTAIAGIESHLRFEYGQDQKENSSLFDLINISPITDTLRQEIHELRKYRNKWVHVAEPKDDQCLLDNTSEFEKEAEAMATKAIKLLRQVIYLEQFV